MCGITGGVWTDSEKAISRECLAQMTEVLRHRGPDDEGFYTSDLQIHPGLQGTPGVALGFRRLCVIDLAGGRQPISNEDGSIWMVVNGEIYNHAALRRRLEGSGHTLRTRCDIEVIVHLYEDEGPRCLESLVGMFALAIWDAKKGILLLARDRLGQKPLFLSAQPDRLIFASELKSLLQVADLPREIDPQALDEFLTYQYVPAPRTIFKTIHKLPPAHYAVYDRGSLSVHRYWQPDLNSQNQVTAQVAQEQLLACLTQSVQLRLASDVPLGAFLSGGIDSSMIVALAGELLQQPLHTFSMGFLKPEGTPETVYDETAYAQQVARKLGTNHHEFRIGPEAVTEVLPQLVWYYDEPFADSSAVPTWWLSKFTRQEVTVALTGDGGDELFAGYPQHLATRLADYFDRLPAPLRWLGTASFWQRLPGGRRQRGRIRQFKRLVEALGLEPAQRHLQWIAIFNETRRAQLYNEQWITQLGGDPVVHLAAAMQTASGRDPVTRGSLADLLTYLPGDLMTKVDVASMAHGLECRSPFLDHRVVEFAAGLPVSWKIRWGRGKWLLRQACAGKLPDSVLKRPKKGFGVPLEPWFRGPLRGLLQEVLLDDQTLSRGYFRPEAVRQLVDDHLQERFDHSARLWLLLIWELWQREWLSRDVPAKVPTASLSTHQ